jgi:predicted lipid-binding transport protein (Tim44 family)
MNARRRATQILAVLAAGLILASGPAEARAGRGGFGFGSRGARTFDAPKSTPTAPRPAAPIERSATPVQPAAPAARAGVNQPAAMAPGGMFRRGGGFLGGFLGAGLIGMLLGYGLFGGLAGLGSILGLLLQVGLVALLVAFVWRAFQRRQQPAYAGMGRAAPGPGAGPTPRPQAASGNVRDGIGIGQADLDSFERILGEVQTAYGQEDAAALRRLARPEVADQLERELAENAREGVVNRIRDVRLLQGDLAEAWRENGLDYATVAMRFGLVDWNEEKGSGRVVAGDAGRPVEATEVWTFVRPRGGRWQVSAIQPV